MLTGGTYGLVPEGEIPVNCCGEFQFDTVEGDWPGEASSLSDGGACNDDAVLGINSRPSGIFLRCPRCFSSMFNRPSFVKGLGRTSFMPETVNEGQKLILPEHTMLEIH